MMQSTAATLPTYGNFFDFNNCSGTPETYVSPFNVVLTQGKCVCCGGLTQTQLAGYYTHPQCAQMVKEYIKLANTEIPQIRMQIMFGSRRCLEASLLSIGQDNAKFQRIKKDIENKAWKIFKQKHPIPWKRTSI